MRRTTTSALCTIALITLYALFLSYAHATTTVEVDPTSGVQGTTFTATATTTVTLGSGDWCTFRWYYQNNTKFRTAIDDASPFTDSWASTTSHPIETYTVKATFYNETTELPIESAGSTTFELTAVPVFPFGLILPIIALIIFFVIIDKKFMKPHGASISQFLLLRRSCGASTNSNSIH